MSHTPAKNLVALDSYLSLPDVIDLLKISTSSLYRWIEAGSFPRPHQLGDRCVRWTVADIKAWQETRQPADRMKKAS
ncbi:AlpA family phage regulatory protein [Rhizobium nepotum]|jgi:prophage regulatory protein|uniref:helix-turn-helix transcriptional regulator n=1 Tax=Rhizobium nepotum TaxID=1035271 RepID=UPI00336ACB44